MEFPGRKVSSELDRALTTRELKFTTEMGIAIPPVTKKLRLKYNHSMFAGTIDGLTEACLRQLMSMYECEEKLVAMNSKPIGKKYSKEELCEKYGIKGSEIPDSFKDFHKQREHYAYLTHKFTAYTGKTAPYTATTVKCKTYWFPVGARFNEGKCSSLVRSIPALEDPSVETDATIRRKLQQCALQRAKYRTKVAMDLNILKGRQFNCESHDLKALDTSRGRYGNWDQINLTVNDGIHISHHDFWVRNVECFFASPPGNVRKVIDTMRWGKTPCNPYVH